MGAGRDRDRCSEGCLNNVGAWWTRRGGSGSCGAEYPVQRVGPDDRDVDVGVTAPENPGGIGERAVRGRVADAGPAAAVGMVGVPVAGPLGGSRGARLCGIGWRRPVAGLRHAGCRCRRRHGRSGPWSPAGRGVRDTPTGLMPEQKLAVPACPRRENGHLWRFDRERSTTDCQADVCQACGLVRLTSYSYGAGGAYAGPDDGA